MFYVALVALLIWALGGAYTFYEVKSGNSDAKFKTTSHKVSLYVACGPAMWIVGFLLVGACLADIIAEKFSFDFKAIVKRLRGLFFSD